MSLESAFKAAKQAVQKDFYKSKILHKQVELLLEKL